MHVPDQVAMGLMNTITAAALDVSRIPYYALFDVATLLCPPAFHCVRGILLRNCITWKMSVRAVLLGFWTWIDGLCHLANYVLSPHYFPQ